MQQTVLERSVKEDKTGMEISMYTRKKEKRTAFNLKFRRQKCMTKFSIAVKDEMSKNLESVQSAQDKDRWRDFVNEVMNLSVLEKAENISSD